MTAQRRCLIVAVSMAAIAHCADAASIYRCRSYSGVDYWSENVCSKSNGLMVDIVAVPDGLPFAEQTKLGDQKYKDKAQAQTSAEDADKRAQQCSAIDRELAEIWNNYKDAQFVPAEQVSAHQNRTRDLNNTKSKLKCPAG